MLSSKVLPLAAPRVANEAPLKAPSVEKPSVAIETEVIEEVEILEELPVEEPVQLEDIDEAITVEQTAASEVPSEPIEPLIKVSDNQCDSASEYTGLTAAAAADPTPEVQSAEASGGDSKITSSAVEPSQNNANVEKQESGLETQQALKESFADLVQIVIPTDALAPSSEPRGLQGADEKSESHILSTAPETLATILALDRSVDDAFKSYRAMLRSGLPMEVVQHKMRLDKFDWKKHVSQGASGDATSSVSVVDATAHISQQQESIGGASLKEAPPATEGIIAQADKESIDAPVSPLKERALKADASVQQELLRLGTEIRNIGERDGEDYCVKFKALVQHYETICDGVARILTRAKMRHLVVYAGDILYQGKDDEKVVNLISSNLRLLEQNLPTIPLPKPSTSIPTSSAPRKTPVASKLMAETRQTMPEASRVDYPKQEQATVSAHTSTGLNSDDQVSVHSTAVAPSSLPLQAPLSSSESTESTLDASEKASIRTLDVSDTAGTEQASDIVQLSEPVAVVEESSPLIPSEEASIQANEAEPNGKSAGESGVIDGINELSYTNTPSDAPLDEQQLCPKANVSEDSPMQSSEDEHPTDITGRGPPPMPPSVSELLGVEPSEKRDDDRDLPLPPALRRRTISTLNAKARSPSRTGQPPVTESMFDKYGRRRSSATVFRVALSLMQSSEMETIPRDDITDALQWTEKLGKEEVFSFENAASLNVSKMLEKIKHISPGRSMKRQQSDQFMFEPRKANSNGTHDIAQVRAAVVIQRVMRGWMTRLRYRSCRWVRARLNSAVQSRLPEKVEEALAASRAISAKFARPPEHDFAIASLDTIREEQALRSKLLELSEVTVNERTTEENSVRKYMSVMNRLTLCRNADPYAFRDEVSQRALLVYESMSAYLQIGKRIADAQLRMSPSEMMAVLHEADTLASKYTGIWSEHLLDEPKNALRQILVAIQHEEPAITGILRACTSPDEVYENPELLFNASNTDDLDSAVVRAVEDLGVSPLTPGALLVLTLGNAMLALKRSLVQQNSSKSPARWTICERLFAEAREKLKAWSDSLPSPDENGKRSSDDFFGSWISVVERELNLISMELDKKAGVHDIIAALQDSVERCDIDDIRNLLRKGEKRGLQDRVHDAALQETLRKANKYLEQFSAIHERLMEAFSAQNRDPAELRRLAIVAQQQVLPNSTDARLVEELFAVCKHADEVLVPLINQALHEMPDRTQLQELVRKIVEEERMGEMQELKAITSLLDLGEVRLIQEQLRACAKHGNEARKTRLMVRLREIHLESNPSMFNVNTFADLKDPKEWSQESTKRIFTPLKRDARAARMLVSSRHPIHAPLTRSADSDPKFKRFAISANRTLLAYTGDLDVNDMSEFGGDVCQGLHELLAFAHSEPAVRDEVYCQLMKHLSENKRPGSVTRAWNVFAFCLITFPPSACFDLYVEHFIRSNAPRADLDSLLNKLHLVVFSGERPTPPTLSDIRQRQDDGGSVEGLCRRTTPTTSLLNSAT